MNTPLSTGAAESAAADAYDVQPRQVPHVPKSKGFSTQTLIPTNMASAAQQALDLFEQHHGDIDAYLATRLGYGSVDELHQYFSAEQFDASALAIGNLEQGAGFITGDQTGIGKGRICASIMRYAQQQGKIALFITKDKPLYADMMRDVSDIGMRRFSPFITDSSTEIPLANGAALKTAGAAKQKEEMQAMMQRGNLGHYSAVYACQVLTEVPSSNDVRYHLNQFEDMIELEMKANEALQGRLPDGIRNHRHRLAMDLHLIPYYGVPNEQEVPYIYRSKAKAGTTTFFAYATVNDSHILYGGLR
jgi:hypothetical protein